MLLRVLKVHSRVFVGVAVLWVALAAIASSMAGSSFWFSTRESSRLIVIHNALAPSHFLPRSYLDKLSVMPDVDGATEVSSIVMLIANLPRPVGGVIVDKESFSRVMETEGVGTREYLDWRKDRNGLVVSTTLARRLGLRVGSSVAARLLGDMSGGPTNFRVAGIGHGAHGLLCDHCVLIGRDLIDAAVPSYQGIVSSFVVKAAANVPPADMMKRIDESFANDSFSTRSSEYNFSAGAYLRKVLDMRGVAMVGLLLAFFVGCCIPIFATMLLINENAPIISLIRSIGVRRGRIESSGAAMLAAACATIAIAGFGFSLLASHVAEQFNVAWYVIDDRGRALLGAIACATFSSLLLGVPAFLRLRGIRLDEVGTLE